MVIKAADVRRIGKLLAQLCGEQMYGGGDCPWFSVNANQTFNTCNSSLINITCTTKLINTAARLVRANLEFCTSWGTIQYNTI